MQNKQSFSSNKQSLLLRNRIPKNPPSRSRKAKEGWQKVKLGEVMNVYGGGTPSTQNQSYWNGDIPWLTPAELTNYENRSIAGTASYITQSGLQNSSAKVMPENSVLLTSRATIGEVVINTVPMATNQGFINIEPKKVDRDFFYYWLKNKRKYLNQIAVGSTFPELSKSVFKEIETEIPIDIEEQKKVASIPSAFDDKIEVNNKIAKTLEEMAQAIFKEWFVHFRFPGYEKAEFVDSELGKIPKGWEAKKVGQILALKHGFAFKSGQFTTNKTRNIVVRMGNFQEIGGLQFSDNTFYLTDVTGYGKYVLKPGDMVMIFSDITREGRLIGSVGLIPNDENIYVLNQRVAKIDYDEIYKYFLLSLFNSKVFHQHCLARADSATVLNLKNEHISEYRIADPGKDILDKFNKVVSPIFKKLESIKKGNQKLAALRDLLLPKLMNGEIRT